MRLIDADALMEDLSKWLKEVDPTHPPEDSAMPPMEDIIVSTLMTIEEQPTIEAVPERKNGRWERHYTRPNVYADLFWHCSVCGYKTANSYANIYYKFCPNCGASMTEGAEDDKSRNPKV